MKISLKLLFGLTVIGALVISCHHEFRLGMQDAKHGEQDDAKYDDYDERWDDLGFAPLHLACITGDRERAEQLVKEGKDINVETIKRKRSPLHYACVRGHRDMVDFLIQKKANVDKEDNKQQLSPVLYAARAGHVAIVKLLKDKGEANMAVSGAEGYSLIHAAASSGNEELFNYCKAQVFYEEMGKAAAVFGNTPLHYAAMVGSRPIVEILIKDFGNELVNLKNKFGNTALHCAAHNSHVEVVKYLIKMGADPRIENNRGDTAGNSARGKHKMAIVDLLVEALKDWPVPEKFKKPTEEEQRYEEEMDLLDEMIRKGQLRLTRYRPTPPRACKRCRKNF